MPLTEISPTGRFARISTDHPTHRTTPPIDYPSCKNVVIESVISPIFPANRSYSQNGLSQDMSVYEKGSGAEYMAAAGWTGPVATDSRRHRSIPKSSIKFTKSSYNNRSRWLCTFLIIVALLLILIIIAIIVLLATRGTIDDECLSNHVSVFIINPNRTVTTTTMSSSTRVQQSGSSSSSSVIMITTPSVAVSSLKPPNTNSSSTFNCTIYIINQANSRYNNNNSFEYADASQILRQAVRFYHRQAS